MTNTTDFGFEEVRIEEKARRVAHVFDSVANRYDLMNDLMSLGLHRLWKHFTRHITNIRPGQQILDLAGGTGDLAKRFVPLVGKEGNVCLCDINGSMLRVGRDRLLNMGLVTNLQFVQGNAEQLPFPDNHFDLITIAFGLRNVTHKDQALASMFRVLKPGGRLFILEFSKVIMPLLQKPYDFYSFNLLPHLGQLIAKDRASYQYLVESIRRHPDQASLKSMMEKSGFESVDYLNLHAGIVALHRGYKF